MWTIKINGSESILRSLTLVTSRHLFLVLHFHISSFEHSFSFWGSTSLFPVCNCLHTPWRTGCFMGFSHAVQLCGSIFSYSSLLKLLEHLPLPLSASSASLAWEHMRCSSVCLLSCSLDCYFARAAMHSRLWEACIRLWTVFLSLSAPLFDLSIFLQ